MAQNLNIATTAEAWADIVIKNWQRKIIELDIGDTGALYESFVQNVIGNADGIPERIELAHEYYGNFVDMGVGKGVYVGNPGDVNTRRKAKPWKSKILFYQVIRLSELLSEKFGILGAAVIKENIIENEKQASFKSKSGHAAPQRSTLSELDKVWMRRNGLLN